MKITPNSQLKPCKKLQKQKKQVNSQPMASASQMTDAQSNQNSDDADSFNKRKYDTISDEDRLKLILLIKEFGMSCHKASKVLNIAYNNAKVIYRIYKNEKRIRQTPKQQKRHAKTIRADSIRQRQREREARVEALINDEASDTADDCSEMGTQCYAANQN